MKEIADMVLLNGKVWTVNPDQPWAEAVAVKGDRILEVHSSKKIKENITTETQVIDLEGDLVLPGFIDSHTHFLDGGFSLLHIHLEDVKNREEFSARIKKKANEIGKGEWILKGNWNQELFDMPELPRKEWIDEVTLDNPVSVNRYDMHMALANSLALRLAGITKETPSPEGGEIHRNPETGEPTGILKDAAMSLVMRHVPEPSFSEKMKAAEAALKHATEAGVTSVHEIGSYSNFEVYQELLREGKLTIRLNVYIPITEIEFLRRIKLKASLKNNFLKIGGLKGFIDGSLGSSTALFFEPYEDDPAKSGLLYSHMFPNGIMEERIMQADEAGLQVAVHAIGDKANNILLNIYERVMSQNRKRDRRWRVEHAQHLLPDDIERIARLGLIVSVQPYHVIEDGQWMEKKIGRKRCQFSYPFQSLLKGGAVLTCSSDWTVAPLNPLVGIYAAVTRQTLDGKNPGGWIPGQKISLEEAVRGFTLNGAYAEFAEKSKGSIEKGKLADLVVLSKNIFTIPPEEIQETEIKMTIFNGEVIYRKDELR